MILLGEKVHDILRGRGKGIYIFLQREIIFPLNFCKMISVFLSSHARNSWYVRF
jgi:hypothetical protein